MLSGGKAVIVIIALDLAILFGCVLGIAGGEGWVVASLSIINFVILLLISLLAWSLLAAVEEARECRRYLCIDIESLKDGIRGTEKKIKRIEKLLCRGESNKDGSDDMSLSIGERK